MAHNYERNEYPRPQFARRVWTSLNGTWKLRFDDAETGVAQGFPLGIGKGCGICVPFAYQCAASGVEDKKQHEVLWYERTFSYAAGAGRRVLLCFNAVDYEADVWLNGKYVGGHIGGYTPFSFDVTDYLCAENTLVVRATDRNDAAQPRGKQYWEETPNRCWYRATSGIWQSVWLEETGGAYFTEALFTPDIDRRCVEMQFSVRGAADTIRISASYRGELVKVQEESVVGKLTPCVFRFCEADCIDEIHYWSPEHPNVYEVKLELLRGGETLDEVETYFAMRKISVDGDCILLNNAPLYQKLVLDQGYWAETDLTPPSAEALRQDILASKAMGFNGARKHQKLEDPYYYYYADRLGFLVWGEMPSAYSFCHDEMRALHGLLAEGIRSLYNHPSVIAIVPMNESWGVRNLLYDAQQKNFVRSLYYQAKAESGGRLVCCNDGWEQVEETDFIGIHDYAPTGDAFADKYVREKYSDLYPMRRRLMGFGEKYTGVPVLLTEYGGAALKASGADARFDAESDCKWGYVVDKDAKSFLLRYKNLTDAARACGFAGYCYTQLTDVKQEVNGLLDEHHAPKIPFDEIAKLNG